MERLDDTDVRLSLSLTGVWGDVVGSAEDLDSWVPFYAIFLAELRFLCAVDLYQLDVLLLKCRCSLFIFWCKSFAMSTVPLD